MADTPKYSSIIDAFLSDREPDWKDLGLKDAKDGGDAWLDHTRSESDLDFLDDLAEGASKHTAVPPTSKGATLQNRLLEQANASSRMGSAQPANTRNAAVIAKSDPYKSDIGDDDSLLDEVTQSFEQAESNATVEKKSRTDAEIQKFIRTLLNQGETPNKVAASLKSLAEVSRFNQKAAIQYLQKNAGMLGTAYLEPCKTAEIELFQKSMSNNYLNDSNAADTGMQVMNNNTFMDKQNPAYGRKASDKTAEGVHDILNSVRDRKMEGRSDLIKSIRSGDRVTIRTPQGQERTGRAVMLGPAGWVLNMGGAHGTPGIASDDNIVKVKKVHRAADEHWLDKDIAEQKKNFDDAGVTPGMLSDAAKYSEEDEVEDEVETEQCSRCEGTGTVCSKCKEGPEDCDCAPLFPGNYDEPAEYADGEDCPECEGQGSVPAYKPTPRKAGLKEASTGADCVRQVKAWKAAGIQPRAKSVKQIAACTDCSYYKKNASTKSCGLYGLPVVGSASELAAVVNRMTAGVPSKSKKAALVQIANRLPAQQIPNKNAASQEAPFQRQAAFTHERDYGFKEAAHFSGAMVQKFHAAGHSLKKIQTAADKKFGALESSKGIREFVASLTKEKGKIIMAKADADYLKNIGIHNEAIVGAAKCASCKAHTSKEVYKSASTEMVTRAPETFVEATLGTLRGDRKKVAAHFDSAKVAKLHEAGLTLKAIVKEASERYGSAQTSKAVRDWAHNLKNTNTKIALSQIDCTVLSKMGVKLTAKNAIIGEAKCGSCNFRNGMACGLTGGTLLSFPGLNQIASNKKVAAGAPEDGRSMLNEYDLVHKSAQTDIDMKEPERADIQMSATMDAGDI